MDRRKLGVAVLCGAAVLVGVAAFSVRGLIPSSGPSRAHATVIREDGATLYVAASDVLFDVGSAALRPRAVPQLREVVADIRRSHPTGTIRVEGYTDDVGPADYNFALSADRARAVTDWLVQQGGLDRSRILLVPFGEGSPVVPNDSDEHRQINRRVVIHVAD